MDLLQLESVLSSVAPVTPLEALQNLLLALGLGLTVAALHRFSKLETNPSPAMLSAIVLLPPISSLVMMVIGNSLARAFSLVGALAIIRFRTRLRSPWDITFIFLSLSVGVGCGVGAHTVSIVGVVVVGLAVLLLGALPGTRPAPEAYQLRCDISAHQCGASDLEPVLGNHVDEKFLFEARTSRFGEAMSLSWRVVLKPESQVETLLGELAAVEGVERATLLANYDAVNEPE